ncbi:MAG: hypothetical protein MJE77_25405 [Proteobacteria bacterium]|nr:hypothetical protein [Pseudomonadota bacterium]
MKKLYLKKSVIKNLGDSDMMLARGAGVSRVLKRVGRGIGDSLKESARRAGNSIARSAAAASKGAANSAARAATAVAAFSVEKGKDFVVAGVSLTVGISIEETKRATRRRG